MWLLALLAVPVVMFLFPEQTGVRNHYDGNFGDTNQTLRPLDDLSNDEHNKVGSFFGYCQGDEQK